MGASDQQTTRQAIRASILHCTDDPLGDENSDAAEYIEDGLLVIENGYITNVGAAQGLMQSLPQDSALIDYRGKLVVPGFIDTHTHFVQTDIIASSGRRLLDWLNEYTYPAERKFSDPEHSRVVATFFINELLRNGTTTALVMGTVHETSADAIFNAAERKGMRIAAGQVMMDRNCPEDLRDTPETACENSKALIDRWHNKGRLQYAVSPRFAPTSTPEQLEVAGELIRTHEDLILQTHLAENEDEVAWVREVYPGHRSYLDVYDKFGLLRERSVLAHGIWLDDTDVARLSATGAAIAHCPTCNLFMGSGLLDVGKMRSAGVLVALGTDIGGGTSFCMLDVMHEAYKAAQLLGQYLSPMRIFYMATLAGARAMGLDDRIGNFLPGKEADFLVLDPQATTLLKRRMAHANSLAEILSAFMILGDDRVVAKTYVMGQLVHDRMDTDDPALSGIPG